MGNNPQAPAVGEPVSGVERDFGGGDGLGLVQDVQVAFRDMSGTPTRQMGSSIGAPFVLPVGEHGGSFNVVPSTTTAPYAAGQVIGTTISIPDSGALPAGSSAIDVTSAGLMDYSGTAAAGAAELFFFTQDPAFADHATFDMLVANFLVNAQSGDPILFDKLSAAGTAGRLGRLASPTRHVLLVPPSMTPTVYGVLVARSAITLSASGQLGLELLYKRA
jgi:hypothetical protein